MSLTSRSLVPVTVLLVFGVAVTVIGAAAVVRDVAQAVRAPMARSRAPEPAPSTHARGLEPVWWLRACLAARRCREAGTAVVAEAVDAHARTLWGGVLAIAAAVACAALPGARVRRPHRPLGSAHFASVAELRRLTGGWFPLGYAPRGRILRRAWRAAWCPAVGRAIAGNPVRLSDEDLARHVLVVGLTGARKTTAVTFPALLEAARQAISVVALDLKYGEGDSLARAALEWRRQGRDVLIFAPLDPLSLRWNPLAGCRTLGAAQHLAALLFDDVDPADPDLMYWMGAERHVCAALGLALATDGGPPTLERLRALCEAGPGAVHAYVRAHPAAEGLTARLGAYRAMLPKDEAGILQGIASRLEAWGDEAVCRATGEGPPWEQIDLRRLRREPVLLLVGVPQPALPRLRWLCHVFLKALAAHLLRPRGPDERVRVLEVLEELPAWGPIPGLADHLATFRSRQVSVLATIQSEAQGEHTYGRAGWAAVSANLVTKIYFSSLADPDAERLSRALGTATTPDIAQTRGWGEGGRRGGEQRREVPVPLRRPEELQGIGTDEEEILVRCPHRAPARLWCPPFHARPEYRGRLPDLPPGTPELVVYHHLRRMSGQRRADAPHGPDGGGPASDVAALSRLRAGPPVPRGPDGGGPVSNEPLGDGAAGSARSTRSSDFPRPGDRSGPVLPGNGDPGVVGPVPETPAVARPPGGKDAAVPGGPPAIQDRPRASPIPPGAPFFPPVVAPAARPAAVAVMPRRNGPPAEGAAATAEDRGTIAAFVHGLLAQSRESSCPAVRGVRRGGRLVEVRVDPEVAARLCGGADAMHTIVRRWAALRWARRIRPVFVLERPALDAIGADLRRRLDAACDQGSGRS